MVQNQIPGYPTAFAGQPQQLPEGYDPNTGQPLTTAVSGTETSQASAVPQQTAGPGAGANIASQPGALTPEAQAQFMAVQQAAAQLKAPEPGQLTVGVPGAVPQGLTVGAPVTPNGVEQQAVSDAL